MKKAEKEQTGRGAMPVASAPGTGRTGTGRRYGEATKRQVVEEIEAGRLTVAQAQRQYGIAGSQTIRNWQGKYGSAGGGVRRASAQAAAQAEIAKLRREKAELEHALARSSVKVIVLESAMEEAEAVYGEDFKKKFAARLPSVREGGCGRRR